MKDYFVVLGRIFIFSTLLPGVIGYVGLAVLFGESQMLNYGLIKLLILACALGFVANAIGHFHDAYCRKPKEKRWPHSFLKLVDKLNQVPESFRNIYYWEVAYVENLHDFYFNSAVVLIIVPLFKCLHMIVKGRFCWNSIEWILVIPYVLVIVFLWLLSNKLLKGIDTITNHSEKESAMDKSSHT